MDNQTISVVNADELEWQGPKGGSAGVVAKVFRFDPKAGACARLISISPNWRKDNRGACYHEAAEEMLFFRGDVTLDETYTLIAGCYFYRPAGLVHGNTERSEHGCLGITISDGKIEWHRPTSFPGGKYTGEYLIDAGRDPRGHIQRLDTNKMEWKELPNGIEQKILSQDRITGAKTSLIRIPVGFRGAGLHYHNCAEELYVIEGTVIVGGDITYKAGTYAYHPRRVPHGEDERSEEGALIFMKHHGHFEILRLQAKL